jgi:isopentenyl-diphosphate delta-isomerase
VFIGRSDLAPTIDQREISAWRWVGSEALTRELAEDRDGVTFTPWFRLEWERVWRDHRPAILALGGHAHP